MKTLTEARPDMASGLYKVYRDAFLRSLAAENKSPRTIQTYGEAVDLLEAFLAGRGMPVDPSAITREHLTEWVNELLDRWKASTALNRYRSAYRFFEYLTEAGETTASPMARMKPPKVEEEEVPIVRDGDLQKLLKTCEGKLFRDRRDAALVLAFVDTGLRVSEMSSIRVADAADGDSYLDLAEGVLYVVGKGKRHRRVPFGKKARRVLDLYLFARAKHPRAEDPFLWIGERGRIGASGMYQIIEKRCEQTGIPRIHPPPVQAHLRPQDAAGQHQRLRPHVPRRLAHPLNA